MPATEFLARFAAPRTAAPSSERVFRPEPFRLSAEHDRAALGDLLSHQPDIHVCDTLQAQLGELIRTRNPSRKFSGPELKLAIQEHTGETSIGDYGVWWYFRWSRRLVHLLDEAEFVELRTNRNRYKITAEEQAELGHKRIGIVGLSAGKSAAVVLAMERSCGELRLADFDRLDLSNLNRVCAGVHDLGLPKVYIAAREIAEIDPYLRVVCYPEGITAANCDAFLGGNSPLDLVLEECDSLDIKLLVREAARRHRIPVVMDTSDRGMIDVERFDLEPQRSVFHGLVGNLSPDHLCGLTTEQKIPYVLKIVGLEGLSLRQGASLIEIDQTISTWPQLASAVTHGGAAAADVARRILLGDLVKSGRYYADLQKLIPGTAAAAADPSQPPEASDAPTLDAAYMMSVINRMPQCPNARMFSPAPDAVRQLVTDAALAPSGGNCQPWKWVACNGQLFLFHDSERSRTAWDLDGMGGLVALGASTENLVLSANAHGLQVRADLFPCGDNPELVVHFNFIGEGDEGAERPWRSELYSLVPLRRTNRKLGTRRPIDASDIDTMTAAVQSILGAHICWLLDERELQECANLIGEGDRFLFLNPSCHRSLFSEIRWTPKQAGAARDGISIESLELSPLDEAGLRLCRDWSVMRTLRSFGGGANLERGSRQAISHSGAVGLITMPGRSALAYLLGGRAVQRLWLTATERRLALHPMTALPYLLAQLDTPNGTGFDAAREPALTSLRLRYSRLFPTVVNSAPVFLFRLSHAEETIHRSLRRDLSEILVPAERVRSMTGERSGLPGSRPILRDQVQPASAGAELQSGSTVPLQFTNPLPNFTGDSAVGKR